MPYSRPNLHLHTSSFKSLDSPTAYHQDPLAPSLAAISDEQLQGSPGAQLGDVLTIILIISDKPPAYQIIAYGPTPGDNPDIRRDLQRSEFQHRQISRLWTNLIVSRRKTMFSLGESAPKCSERHETLWKRPPLPRRIEARAWREIEVYLQRVGPSSCSASSLSISSIPLLCIHSSC